MDIVWHGGLIQGDSGIGKSETGLELVKRGHRLVADDRVDAFGAKMMLPFGVSLQKYFVIYWKLEELGLLM